MVPNYRGTPVSEMHGELLEFNQSLLAQNMSRERQLADMEQRLLAFQQKKVSLTHSQFTITVALLNTLSMHSTRKGGTQQHQSGLPKIQAFLTDVYSVQYCYTVGPLFNGTLGGKGFVPRVVSSALPTEFGSEVMID
eukprot:sb/3474494/